MRTAIQKNQISLNMKIGFLQPQFPNYFVQFDALCKIELPIPNHRQSTGRNPPPGQRRKPKAVDTPGIFKVDANETHLFLRKTTTIISGKKIPPCPNTVTRQEALIGIKLSQLQLIPGNPSQ
jgi:hypothetical protein